MLKTIKDTTDEQLTKEEDDAMWYISVYCFIQIYNIFENSNRLYN